MAVANSTGVIASRSTTLSAADVAAHEAASHVRLPRRTPVTPSAAPSAAELSVTTEIAYIERDRQDAHQLAYELAAGGAL